MKPSTGPMIKPANLASFLIALLLTAGARPANADDTSKTSITDTKKEQSSSPAISEAENQIRMEDRRIFIELVKLAEFNVRFQQTVNHYAGWRKLIYPLGQETVYASFLGFSTSDLSQRGRGWNNLALISPTSTKQALAAATAGSLVGAASSLLELSQDGIETLIARTKGFSVRESVSHVKSAVKEVDEQLAIRHALMEKAEFRGTRRELLELKEELLKYERDRLIFEFKRWSAHSRGYAWYRNAFYVINTAVNMGRFSAIQLGFKSFTQPRCTGATGPILITSAIFAGLGPFASSTIGNCMRRHQEKSLSKDLPISPFLSDEEAKNKFERLTQLLKSDETNKQHAQLASELIRMREEKLGLDTLIFHEEKVIGRLRRVAGQQAITAPAISTLGLTSGILGTVGYYAYRQQPNINNKFGFAGDATVIPAETVAIVATPLAAILAEKYERNLKRRGEHPDQLLSTRLKDLKALEERVNEVWR